MSKIELLKMLEREAIELRNDKDFLKRNSHMHVAKGPIDQAHVDAVLICFINAVGSHQGVDYGLYSKDLSDPTNRIAK